MISDLKRRLRDVEGNAGNLLLGATDFVDPPWRRRQRLAFQERCAEVDHYTFVATTGRSGSQKLTQIISCVPGYVSLHEPEPVMNGTMMIRKNRGTDGAARRCFHSRKLLAIYRACAEGNARYYVETNHMFIKSFSDYAIQHFGAKIRVVHLIRDPQETAHSIYQLGEIPGDPEGNHWYLDPGITQNHIRLTDEFWEYPEFQHPYYRCLWYVFEIQARVESLKREHPSVPIFRMETPELSQPDSIHSLSQFLGVAVEEEALEKCLTQRANQQQENKQKANMPKLSATELKSMTNRFVTFLKENALLPAESACPE